MSNSPPIAFKKSESKFILWEQFRADDPVYVFDIGWHKTPPEHCFGPAVRPYYLLHLVEKGRGEVEREGVVTKVGAGEAFLIRPQEITTYRSDKEDPWEYYWISFYGDFSHELVKQTGDKLFTSFRKSGLLALKQAIESETGDPLECLSVLFQTLSSLKKDSRSDERQDVVATALRIIESNYFRPLDVSSIASQLGFTRAYFSTLFAEKTGETPYRYLTKIRISRAKEYLQNDALSVEEIAFSVGFSSIQRFSEMFKKYTGMTPGAYRSSVSASEPR